LIYLNQDLIHFGYIKTVECDCGTEMTGTEGRSRSINLSELLSSVRVLVLFFNIVDWWID